MENYTQIKNKFEDKNNFYIQRDVVICCNCKAFWISPVYKCDCGCRTFEKTHPNNIQYAKNIKDNV